MTSRCASRPRAWNGGPRRGSGARRGGPPNRGAAAGAAAASPLSAATGAALNSPIPISGIPLRLFAAPYKGTAPRASLAIALEMRADAFRFSEKNGTFFDRVEVAFSAVDASGKVWPGNRHVLTMEMSAATAAVARERGMRVLSEFALPPGRYQLRVATAEEGAGRSGSVFYDVEVPDFQKAGFAMSGLTLTAASAQAMPTVRPQDPLAGVLPAPPTTSREFERSDVVALFAEFYENASTAPPHTIQLATTVRAEDGRVVFENREQRSSTDLQGARSGGYGYGIRVPLSDFAPGAYVIRVEGRPQGGATATGREVLIRVR